MAKIGKHFGKSGKLLPPLCNSGLKNRWNINYDEFVKSPKYVTPAKAGVQTSSLRKQGTILQTGFLFSQETLDSCFRRNDEMEKN